MARRRLETDIYTIIGNNKAKELNLTYDTNGGEITIDIYSTAHWTDWGVENGMMVSGGSRNPGHTQIKAIKGENESEEEISDFFKIVDINNAKNFLKVNWVQEYVPSISIEGGNYTFPYYASTKKFYVTSNGSWQLDRNTLPSWVTCTVETDEYFELSCEANNWTLARAFSEITVSMDNHDVSASIQIGQSAGMTYVGHGEATITFYHGENNLWSYGFTSEVNIPASAAISIGIRDGASDDYYTYCLCSGTSITKTDTNVATVVGEHPEIDVVYTEFDFWNDGVHYVIPLNYAYIEAYEPYIEIEPNVETINENGGVVTLSITSNTTWELEVWTETEAGSSEPYVYRTGNGTMGVDYTIPANSEHYAKTYYFIARVTATQADNVEDQCSVEQSAAAVIDNYLLFVKNGDTLNDETIEISPDGGEYIFRVDCNTPCHLNILNDERYDATANDGYSFSRFKECQSCGAILEHDDRECEECGEVFFESQDEQNGFSNSMYCSSGGMQMYLFINPGDSRNMIIHGAADSSYISNNDDYPEEEFYIHRNPVDLQISFLNTSNIPSTGGVLSGRVVSNVEYSLEGSGATGRTDISGTYGMPGTYIWATTVSPNPAPVGGFSPSRLITASAKSKYIHSGITYDVVTTSKTQMGETYVAPLTISADKTYFAASGGTASLSLEISEDITDNIIINVVKNGEPFTAWTNCTMQETYPLDTAINTTFTENDEYECTAYCKHDPSISSTVWVKVYSKIKLDIIND